MNKRTLLLAIAAVITFSTAAWAQMPLSVSQRQEQDHAQQKLPPELQEKDEKRLQSYGLFPMTLQEDYTIEVLEKKSGKENVIGKIKFLPQGDVIFEYENNTISKLKQNIEKRHAIALILWGGDVKGIHYKEIITVPQYTNYFISAVETFLKLQGYTIKALP